MVAAVAVVVFFPSSFFNMVYSFYVIFFSLLGREAFVMGVV